MGKETILKCRLHPQQWMASRSSVLTFLLYCTGPLHILWLLVLYFERFPEYVNESVSIFSDLCALSWIPFFCFFFVLFQCVFYYYIILLSLVCFLMIYRKGWMQKGLKNWEEGKEGKSQSGYII